MWSLYYILSVLHIIIIIPYCSLWQPIEISFPLFLRVHLDLALLSSNTHLNLIFKNANNWITLLNVFCSKSQNKYILFIHYNVVMSKYICSI